MSNRIKGVEIFEGEQFGDHRGWFTELFNHTKMPNLFPNGIRQISRSYSNMNVIRGLHFQINPQMDKLIHVVEGSINLYIVDTYPRSETFGKYMAIKMSAIPFKRVYIPGYCAVGFETPYSDATIEYFHSATRNDEGAMTIKWNDADINIPWQTKAPKMSENDKFKGISLQEWAERVLTKSGAMV